MSDRKDKKGVKNPRWRRERQVLWLDAVTRGSDTTKTVTVNVTVGKEPCNS